MEIIRETTEAEKFRYIYTKKSFYNTIKWRGYIHPLNSTIKFLYPNLSVIYTFKLMVENISIINLGISRDDSREALVRIHFCNLSRVMRKLLWGLRPGPTQTGWGAHCSSGKSVGLRIGRPGFDPRPGRCVVSLSKRHLLPKSTGNTQK